MLAFNSSASANDRTARTYQFRVVFHLWALAKNRYSSLFADVSMPLLSKPLWGIHQLQIASVRACSDGNVLLWVSTQLSRDDGARYAPPYGLCVGGWLLADARLAGDAAGSWNLSNRAGCSGGSVHIVLTEQFHACIDLNYILFAPICTKIK